MASQPRDLANWIRYRDAVNALMILADSNRPNLAAADTETDVMLTWLESVLECANQVISMITADLTEQDQLESGDLTRDANGDIVPTSH